MTATRKTQHRKSNERRIIERPRLMKVLDASDAKALLLIAPAGYGKTTVARQWASTLQRPIWLTLTPAHQDLSVLAVDLARAIDGVGGRAFDHINRYMLSRPNPQRAAREAALHIAQHANDANVRWIVLDDYHELSGSPEPELFVDVVRSHSISRVLIASRQSPSWATERLAIYGESLELGREMLAMDEEESSRLLGRRRGLGDLVVQAEGWPAVLALAANAGRQPAPSEHSVPTSLYQFFADEMYHSTPPALRDDLMRLALAADLSEETLEAILGRDALTIVDDLKNRGFLSIMGTDVELHPLVRDFLLQKLAADRRQLQLVRPAIEACVVSERWIKAFDLILRFELEDLMEPTLERAYLPLVRTGRLEALSSFARSVRAASKKSPAVVDLVDAETALRDGKFELAAQLAEAVRTRLGDTHSLLARTHSLLGQCFFVQGRLAEADEAYRVAFEGAESEDGAAEALRGWALASVQCEAPDSSWALTQLAKRRHNSTTDSLRYKTVELNRRRFAEGFAEPLEFEHELEILEHVEDPRARSGFIASLAYIKAVRADYEEAADLMRLTDAIIAEYDLDFARPYATWNNALIALGMRHFGVADRLLQSLEDSTIARPVGFHILNARLLRARLWLQTGQPAQALESVFADPRESAIPSIHGEYLASRAIAHALLGQRQPALDDAQRAETTSTAVEVRTLAQVARAVSGVLDGEQDEALRAWLLAEEVGAWDPIITGLRSCPQLSEHLAGQPELRPKLVALFTRTNDIGLARRAGLRVRNAGRPEQLLSPRELEVLELLAGGYRNRDIAEALVVSPSTVKVHIRHIHEKLGVRTRSEAVARLQNLSGS